MFSFVKAISVITFLSQIFCKQHPGSDTTIEFYMNLLIKLACSTQKIDVSWNVQFFYRLFTEAGRPPRNDRRIQQSSLTEGQHFDQNLIFKYRQVTWEKDFCLNFLVFAQNIWSETRKTPQWASIELSPKGLARRGSLLFSLKWYLTIILRPKWEKSWNRFWKNLIFVFLWSYLV